MADAFEKKITDNAKRLIDLGLSGDGPLGSHFASEFNKTVEALANRNKFKRESEKKPPLTPEQQKEEADKIKDEANAKLRQYAESVRVGLIKAGKGESDAALSIQELNKTTQTVGSSVSAITSGGFWGVIGAVFNLLSDSIIGKYASALIDVVTGKSNSVDEGLAKAKAGSAMEKLVGKFPGVDSSILLNELHADTKTSSTPEEKRTSYVDPSAPPGMIGQVPNVPKITAGESKSFGLPA